MNNFKIGQRVLCVKNFKSSQGERFKNVKPLKGITYTIRGIEHMEEGIGLLFEEIINPKYSYTDSFGEKVFSAEHFRPLIYNDAKSEILEKFKQTEEKSDVQPLIKKEQYEQA